MDIGAHDGQTFSNTRALVLKKWGGVCVEPSPSVFPTLQKRYQDNPKIQTLEFAITDITGIIDFYDSGGDLISTISKNHVKLWLSKAGVVFKTIKVNSLTILDLFELIGYDFNFVSLDVEGTNWNVFSQFPFNKLEKTKMICVEYEHYQNEILKLVKPYRYKLLHRTTENLLLIRD